MFYFNNRELECLNYYSKRGFKWFFYDNGVLIAAKVKPEKLKNGFFLQDKGISTPIVEQELRCVPIDDVFYWNWRD